MLHVPLSQASTLTITTAVYSVGVMNALIDFENSVLQMEHAC